MEKFARRYEKSHGGMIFGNGKIRGGMLKRATGVRFLEMEKFVGKGQEPLRYDLLKAKIARGLAEKSDGVRFFEI